MQDQPPAAPTPPPPCPNCGHPRPTATRSTPANDPEQGTERLPAAVVALIAGRLYQAPPEAIDGLLEEAPVRNLVLALADFAGWTISHTTGGSDWLARCGLNYARTTSGHGEA